MTKIIGVWAYKGGVSKTSTSVNLAGALAALGHTVAVIDQDPQGSALAMATMGNYSFPVLDAEQIDVLPDVDYAILDYPPGKSGDEVSGGQDILIIPIKPAWPDYEAAKRGLASLAADEKTLAIVTLVESQKADHISFLDSLRAKYGNDIAQVPKRSAVERANNRGITVFDMPLREHGVKECRAVYTDIAERVIRGLNK